MRLAPKDSRSESLRTSSMSSISSSSFSAAVSLRVIWFCCPAVSGFSDVSLALIRSISAFMLAIFCSRRWIFSRWSCCFSVNVPWCSRQSKCSKRSASRCCSSSVSSSSSPHEAPAAVAAAAWALARCSRSISTTASCSDIFSNARSLRRSSRLRPSSGMSAAAPATMNALDDWPNLIWSPTKTGAWTPGLSLRLFTVVPWVLPQSCTKISSLPFANCSTACSREEEGCSRTTSLFGVRPNRRWSRPAQSIVSMMAPSLRTSREKSTEGTPPHSGCSYPPGGGAAA